MMSAQCQGAVKDSQVCTVSFYRIARHVTKRSCANNHYLKDYKEVIMEHVGGSISESRVLVVDDDPDIVKLLIVILRPLGFVIYQACDGREGLKTAYELHPDLVILDVMLPEMDGWDVCSRLRELSDVPILMLTARSAETDMLRGFGLGADDYIKKPFSKSELEARVVALLRRRSNHHVTPAISRYRDQVLNIDLDTQSVKLNGKALELSLTEYGLLACLVRNMGRTVTHSQLLREVWGGEYGNMAPTLTLYIHYLRKKLDNSKHDHKYIHTQWGRGYCFVPINES
jgi:two-component system, OmpR family, KDP operon response regulator KdpE